MTKKRFAKNTMKKTVSERSPQSFWKTYLYPIAITVFTILLYGNSVMNGYNLDDELVTRNHPLTSQGLKAIPEILISPYYKDNMGYAYDYRPIVHISFAIEHQLFGESAFLSHTVNLILYVICCLFLYHVLMSLFGTSPLFSISVTLLFVSFPLHTETVSNIKNRDELLSLFFAMASFLLLKRVLQGGLWWLVPMSTMFALSLLSKYSSVVFAFVIPAVFFAQCNPKMLYSIAISIALAIPSGVLFQQPALTYRLGFTAIVMFFPVLFYIPYRTILHTLLFLLKSLLKQGQKSLLFAAGELRKFIQQFNLSHTNEQAEDIYNGSIYTTFLVPVLFTVGYFICLFLLGNVSIGIWAVAMMVLMLLLRESLLKHLLSIIFLVGTFLLLLFWRDIDSNNPVPILINTYCVVVVIMLYNKNAHTLLKLIYLSITVFVVIFQLALIGDIGSLFPLMGVLLIWLSKRSKVLYYSIKSAIAILVLIETVFFVMALIKHQPAADIAFEMSTLFCLLITFGLTHKLIKHEVYRIFTLLLLVSVIIFYMPYLRLPNSFNEPSSNLIISHFKVDREDYKPQIFPAESLNLQPKEQLEFELLSTKSDRQFSFVESPVTLWDNLGIRVASASVVALHYLQKVLVPYPMAFYYGYKVFKQERLSSFPVILSIAIHILIVALMMYCLAKYRLMALSIFIYLLSVAALSGFLQTIAGVFADRFVLIPSLGFCIVFMCIVFVLCKNDVYNHNLNHRNISKAMKLIFFSVLFVYSSITIARNAQWKDDLTLMRHDIKYVSESAQANNLLAIHLINRAFQETDPQQQISLRREALNHFYRAQQIYPPFFNVAFDIGRTYILLNKPDSAVLAFEYALTIDTTYPDVYFNLGEQYFNLKNYPKAIEKFTKYVQLVPTEYSGYDKLSYTYYIAGNLQASIETNRQAARSIPSIVDPYVNMANAYTTAGNKDSAVYYLELSNRMLPGNQQIQQLLQRAQNLP